jgi:hypothetical protein
MSTNVDLLSVEQDGKSKKKNVCIKNGEYSAQMGKKK